MLQLIGEITNNLLNLVSIVNYQRLNESYFTMGNSSGMAKDSFVKLSHNLKITSDCLQFHVQSQMKPL